MEFQGHHTNQAYYKSGIMSPEYHGKVNNPMDCDSGDRTSKCCPAIIRICDCWHSM